MRKASLFILIALLAVAGLLVFENGIAFQQEREPLPACEWCGADEAPDDLNWETTIAPPDEPGEPLVINGTVYQPDGVTPASDVILYIYHTNAKGIYPKRGDETGNGRRHGYLRSWVQTNKAGHYRFKTIRPAPYPNRREAAHIHMTVKEPDRKEYWIDSIKFNGDSLLSEADKRSAGLIELSRDSEGVWRGQRNIILKNP